MHRSLPRIINVVYECIHPSNIPLIPSQKQHLNLPWGMRVAYVPRWWIQGQKFVWIRRHRWVCLVEMAEIWIVEMEWCDHDIPPVKWTRVPWKGTIVFQPPVVIGLIAILGGSRNIRGIFSILSSFFFSQCPFSVSMMRLTPWHGDWDVEFQRC